MTDIVERLLIIEPDAPGSKSHCFRNPDGPEAAHEIERLREALHKIACGEGSCGCDIRGDSHDECLHGIARAALGEKE